MLDRSARSARAAETARKVHATRAKIVETQNTSLTARKLFSRYLSGLPKFAGYMYPAELVAKARQRQRSRQTHPGKRGNP